MATIRISVHPSVYHSKPSVILYTSIPSKDHLENLEQSLRQFKEGPYGDAYDYFRRGWLGTDIFPKENGVKKLIFRLNQSTGRTFTPQNGGEDVDSDIRFNLR